MQLMRDNFMIEEHVRTGYTVYMSWMNTCLFHSKYVCHVNTLRVWVENEKNKTFHEC